MTGSTGICTKICCPFFLWDNIEEKSNFSPLNLRMLNSKENTKAIKLIAPPKTQAIPYHKHVSALSKPLPKSTVL